MSATTAMVIITMFGFACFLAVKKYGDRFKKNW